MKIFINNWHIRGFAQCIFSTFTRFFGNQFTTKNLAESWRITIYSKGFAVSGHGHVSFEIYEYRSIQFYLVCSCPNLPEWQYRNWRYIPKPLLPKASRIYSEQGSRIHVLRQRRHRARPTKLNIVAPSLQQTSKSNGYIKWHKVGKTHGNDESPWWPSSN